MLSKKINLTKYICMIALIAIVTVAESALLISELEIQIEAEQQWEQMTSQLPISRDLSKRTLIRCVAKNIIKTLEEPYKSNEWEIELFENPGVNAFAMPGGKLGVYTGIFDVAENSDEIATVIGHEIAHVTNKHSYERAKRDMRTKIGTTIGAAVVAGNIVNKPIYNQSDLYEVNNQMNAVNTMSQMISTYGLNLPFSRKQENDADTSGIIFMARAGFNPLSSLSLWKKMQDQGKRPNLEFVSSHPSSSTRIKELSSQLPKALAAYNEVEKKPNCRYPR